MSDPRNIRNLGIVAHINAGKTTLTERILFRTGKQRFMGEVDSGTATMDFLAEEQRRGISIGAAFTSVDWAGHVLHVVDTPGHVDFTAEVERCMRVLDGVVVLLDGVRGVESQTVTVWRQARHWGVPALVFVNKLDRVGASFAASLQSLRDRLGAVVLPVAVPVRDAQGGAFLGMQEALAAGGPARDALVEAAADLDAAVMERFIADGDVATAEVERALREGVNDGRIVPACGGSALRNIGVDLLLDAVVRYLPSPLDRPPVVDEDDAANVRRCDPHAPTCGLAFKLIDGDDGDGDGGSPGGLSAVRLYSGRVRAGDELVANPPGRRVVVRRLWSLHADTREPSVQAGAGDVIAIRFDGGPVATGATLHAPGAPIRLQPAVFPRPVLTRTVEPRGPGDRDGILAALRWMALDDPTLGLAVSEESGDVLLSGMGELHLDVIAARLREQVGDSFRLGRIEVACREVVPRAARDSGEWRRPELSARAVVAVAIGPRADGNDPAACAVSVGEVSWARPAAAGEALRAELEHELWARARTGLATAWPLHGADLSVERAAVEGEVGVDDGLALARDALRVALQRASAAAGFAVLEPWMRLEVECPAEVVSPVLADLRASEADVREVLGASSGSRLVCIVPLRRMLGYSSRLRSLSRGLATFAMEWEEHRTAPAAVAGPGF